MEKIDEYCDNNNLNFKSNSIDDLMKIENELKRILSNPISNTNNSNNSNMILDILKLILLNSQMPIVQPSQQVEPLDLSQKSIINSKSLPKRLWKPKSFDFDGFFTTQVKRFTANDVCNSRCHMLYKDHYHCFAENGNCSEVMKGKDQLRQHGKRHSVAEELTNLEFKFCLKCHLEETQSHYHCSYADCDFISINSTNLDRLVHVESVHCNIVLKRANNNNNNNNSNNNNNNNNNKNKVSGKRCKLVQENVEKCESILSVSDLPNHLSPISSGSYDNQFIDLNIDPFDKDNMNLNHHSLSLNKNNSNNQIVFDDIENSVLFNARDEEKHLYRLGTCARLFCNLKKADHYHCPICDVGSSKIDLYLRHLKRHK